VGVDDFTNGNVDHWLGEGHQIRILIHVEFILELWHITCSLEKPSAGKHDPPVSDTDVRGWQWTSNEPFKQSQPGA
jgi:hypothetical protein